MDAHRSIALVAGSVRASAGELVSTHYTTVSLIRTIVDVLGIESPGLNDALAEPMADVFETKPRPWSYRAIVPPVLYDTLLPLPPQDDGAACATSIRRCCPDHAARRTTGPASCPARTSNAKTTLETDDFNEALWAGLRGEEVPYPTTRHGQDLRRNRKELLNRMRQ